MLSARQLRLKIADNGTMVKCSETTVTFPNKVGFEPDKVIVCSTQVCRLQSLRCSFQTNARDFVSAQPLFSKANFRETDQTNTSRRRAAFKPQTDSIVGLFVYRSLTRLPKSKSTSKQLLWKSKVKVKEVNRLAGSSISFVSELECGAWKCCSWWTMKYPIRHGLKFNFCWDPWQIATLRFQPRKSFAHDCW